MLSYLVLRCQTVLPQHDLHEKSSVQRMGEGFLTIADRSVFQANINIPRVIGLVIVRS